MPPKKKNSLVANINKRKKAGASRSKANSTISPEAYKNMQTGWGKKAASKKIAKKKRAKTQGAKKKRTAKKKSRVARAGFRSTRTHHRK